MSKESSVATNRLFSHVTSQASQTSCWITIVAPRTAVSIWQTLKFTMSVFYFLVAIQRFGVNLWRLLLSISRYLGCDRTLVCSFTCPTTASRHAWNQQTDMLLNIPFFEIALSLGRYAPCFFFLLHQLIRTSVFLLHWECLSVLPFSLSSSLLPSLFLTTWLAVICQIPPWRLLCLNQSELTSFQLICTLCDWFSSLGIIWCSTPSLPEQIKL